jgi:hypothetical protein
MSAVLVMYSDLPPCYEQWGPDVRVCLVAVAHASAHGDVRAGRGERRLPWRFHQAVVAAEKRDRVLGPHRVGRRDECPRRVPGQVRTRPV